MAVNLRIDPSILSLSHLYIFAQTELSICIIGLLLYCILSVSRPSIQNSIGTLNQSEHTRQNERERERERGNDTRVSHIHTHVYDSCPGEATQRHTELSQRDIHKTERKKERERERERECEPAMIMTMRIFMRKRLDCKSSTDEARFVKWVCVSSLASSSRRWCCTWIRRT